MTGTWFVEYLLVNSTQANRVEANSHKCFDWEQLKHLKITIEARNQKWEIVATPEEPEKKTGYSCNHFLSNFIWENVRFEIARDTPLSYTLGSKIRGGARLLIFGKSSHPPAPYFGPPRLSIFWKFFLSFPKFLLYFWVYKELFI